VGDPPTLLPRLQPVVQRFFAAFAAHRVVTWFVALWLLQRLFKDELKPWIWQQPEAIAS
jgi:hypothetical protein